AIAESARAFNAVIHAGSGTLTTVSRLFRVTKNAPPSVSIVSQVSGSQVSVGQALTVRIEASDDTLGSGLDARLTMNGALAGQFKFFDANPTPDWVTGTRARHE